jgi:outer membrane murein-binding lipoprotein Lpp
MMIKLRLVLFGGMVIAGSMSTAYAGPCSDAIDTMQARIDAKLEAKAAAGPTAKQGVAAGMSVQPTPASIAAAEEKLDEISPKKVKAIRRGMARARVADKVGDLRPCRKALAAVQRVLSP